MDRPKRGRPRTDPVRINITMPPDLLAALDAAAGPNQRSPFIAEWLRTHPKIQEALPMTQAYLIGQLTARIERALQDVQPPMSPNAPQLISLDPAHNLPPLFTRLITSGHKDDIIDLMAQISAETGFPDRMSNAEQGQFWMGYYHEKGIAPSAAE